VREPSELAPRDLEVAAMAGQEVRRDPVEPAAGVVGQTTRALLQGQAQERLLDQVLGQVAVAGEAREMVHQWPGVGLERLGRGQAGGRDGRRHGVVSVVPGSCRHDPRWD
jgi:hypothetical protein